jgi:uncharacterized tellurite resistance protein B-like protein
MIDRVKRLFVKDRKGEARNGPEARHDNIPLAVCALFLEMCHVDGEFAESEREDILGLLRNHYGMPETHVAQLMEASKKELAESIDLWQFTNLINQNYSRDEKIRVIEMIWQLVYADGRLDRHEDYLVHKLAKLLRLTHKELIDAKLKAAESRLPN